MSSKMASIVLPQLSDNNFSSWLYRVECLLEEKKVKYVLEERRTKGDAKDEKAETDADATARNTIVQCISDRHIEYVRDCKTAKAMIEALKKIFQRKSTISKLFIRRKLLSMRCNSSLQDHFIQFDLLIRELEQMSKNKMEMDDKICHLLLTMPKQYDAVITVIENTENLDLETVKAKLLDAELKLKSESGSQSKSVDTAFSSLSNSMPPRICYHCKEPNHYIANCPKYAEYCAKSYRGQNSNRRGRSRGQGQSRGRFRRRWGLSKLENGAGSAAIVSKEGEEVTFIAREEEAGYVVCKQGDGKFSAVLDSGCTHHLAQSNMRTKMFDITMLEQPILIKIADGKTISAHERGKLKLRAGNLVINIEALIVDGLSLNLLSVSQIVKSGKKVVFANGEARIVINKNKFVSCPLVGKLFVVNFELCDNIEQCCVADKNLWHRRLGHINKEDLKKMNLPVSKDVCGPCMEGKSKRQPFPRLTEPKSTRVGEYLHTDVGGPVKVPTSDGHRYWQTVVDDFSHFVMVFTMVEKSEAANNLMKIIPQLETTFGQFCVSKIRCDNGGEFSSTKLRHFCENRGIRLQYTAPYSPSSNGISERFNLTLMNKVRTMFAETNLPKHLWGDAIKSAAYQVNRSPTTALNGDIPARVYCGKLDLSKLRVFGSKAWAHILPRRDKLDPRAREAVLVGYSPNGYKLWDPKTNDFFVSRDVRFDETNFKFREVPDKLVIQDTTSDNEQMSQETDFEECANDQPDPEVKKPSAGDNNADMSSRPKRNIQQPKHLEDYELYSAYCLLSTHDGDPKSYRDAMKEKKWQEAIRNELSALENLGTWTPATLPETSTAIDTRWVFRTKDDGTPKARLVARGYQEPQDEYQEWTYAPVCRMSTVRLLISFAVQYDWPIRQIDVPSAFLNGFVDGEVYIKTPEGVNSTSRFMKLNRALYGLRRSPKCWNVRFNQIVEQLGLRRSTFDYCLYCGERLFLVLWVDDALITGDPGEIEKLIKSLSDVFNVKNMGEVSVFLGMQFDRKESGVKVIQSRIIQRLAEKFNMVECNTSCKTPMEVNFQVEESEGISKNQVPPFYRNLVCSLMYVSVMSRPDICFSVSLLSRFCHKPTMQLWNAAKRVLRYVISTRDMGLNFTKGNDSPNNIVAYSDSDWGGDKLTRRSVSGFIAFHCQNPITWYSRKQNCVALSSMESEFLAASNASQELINLKGILGEITRVNEIKLLVDSSSAISFIKNCENSRRAKHIDIRRHFIKDLVENGDLQIEYVNTNENVSDFLTKPLGQVKFESCVIKTFKASG
uniref:Retrovirus-related Pol polyprotein from transposon TNT 1-94 n=2 Tax=Lygus hesperus TaxID=30085 RepID=A0A0A9XG27_LYGHE